MHTAPAATPAKRYRTQVTPAAPPASGPRKCGISTCKRPVGKTHGAGLLCPFHFVRLPEGTKYVLPALMQRPTCNEQIDVGIAAIGRLSSEDAGQRHGRLTAEQLADADQLTCEFTAFRSFEELITADGGYWPKLPCRCNDPDPRRAHRLANLYDQEQTARGDARRATRVGSCGL